jgi:hypothetical protein
MRTGKRQNAKRIAALAFLLCFIMAALLSEAFVLTHARHRHDHYGAGGSCAVCAQIQNIENQRRQLGAAFVGLPMAWVGLFAAIALLCCVSAARILTPVRLKTRLNH